MPPGTGYSGSVGLLGRLKKGTIVSDKKIGPLHAQRFFPLDGKTGLGYDNIHERLIHPAGWHPVAARESGIRPLYQE
jgi:hypothetical protein